MYLKDKKTGDMVEVLDLSALINPGADRIQGRFHAGEEMQDTQGFAKAGLIFPSGETLPRCWTDRNYPR